MALVDPSNADAVFDAIPSGVRPTFLRWAEDFVSRTSDDELYLHGRETPLPVHSDLRELLVSWLRRRGHVAAA
jgi:hypothetical protein